MLGDSGRNISLNLGIAAIAGYENVNGGETVLYDGALLKAGVALFMERAFVFRLKPTCQTKSCLSCTDVQKYFGVPI